MTGREKNAKELALGGIAISFISAALHRKIDFVLTTAGETDFVDEPQRRMLPLHHSTARMKPAVKEIYNLNCIVILNTRYLRFWRKRNRSVEQAWLMLCHSC